MTLRALRFACVIGLSILGGAGERTLAQKPADPAKPFPVHVTIDITWTDKSKCEHTADWKCHGCQLSGKLSVTVDAKVGKTPRTAALEPVGPAGARISYVERRFCPIDGEGSRTEGKSTAEIRGPSSGATRPFTVKEGHLMLMSVPAGSGMGLNLLSDDAPTGAPAPAGMMANRGNWDTMMPFAAFYEVSDKTGHVSRQDVSLMLLVTDAPEKKSGSVSWQVRRGDYHNTGAFDLRVVDTRGLVRQKAARASEDPDSNAVMNYVVTWRFGAADHTVTIDEPTNNKNFVFGKDEADNIRIEAKATADPASYNDRIQPWNIGEVSGSTLEIKKQRGTQELDERPVKGPQALIRYKKLPSLNDSFGYKNLTCDNAEPVVVKVFYRKNEKDNPGGKERNWYYYWKQGAVPGLEKFQYIESDQDYGVFTPPATLEIGGQAAEPEAGYRMTLYTTDDPEKHPGAWDPRRMSRDTARWLGLLSPIMTISWPRKKSIETCHGTVLHELRHKEIYDLFGGMNDTDGDGLPDWFEVACPLQLDPLSPDTHFLRNQINPVYEPDGDQELLCRLSELRLAPRKNLDWSWKGSQSDPPEK